MSSYLCFSCPPFSLNKPSLLVEEEEEDIQQSSAASSSCLCRNRPLSQTFDRSL
jgi:hypothetical protein